MIYIMLYFRMCVSWTWLGVSRLLLLLSRSRRDRDKDGGGKSPPSIFHRLLDEPYMDYRKAWQCTKEEM